MTHKKKLIEVALPLAAINKASAAEKQPGIGAHPRGLHLWWARRPLAAARAVIFAQMVDDPSAYVDVLRADPKLHRKAKADLKARLKLWEETCSLVQKAKGTGLLVPEPGPAPNLDDMLVDIERQRLFRIIEDLVLWKNSTNEAVLQSARDEIWQSWRRACAENADHPRVNEMYDRKKLPAFHDPFAGGGALPLEAQRLGLESYASDLNPVAVLINKAMIEIPPRFAGKPPINPEGRNSVDLKTWNGAQGIAEDVRYYGKWILDKAKKRIGHLYPKVEITTEMVEARPDLGPYASHKLTVIAWIWVRTVKSPNPAFAQVDVPLASTFMLSTKAGKEAYVEPLVEDGGYRFTVKVGKPKDVAGAKRGTKLSRGANFQCLMSGSPIAPQYIKDEGTAGRMGTRLMAIIAKGTRGRVYLEPTHEHGRVALEASPEWRPGITISGSTQYLGVKPYGMDRIDQLFTDRQLIALTTFSDLVSEAREQIRHDALSSGLPSDPKPLCEGGMGSSAYADAVCVYLTFAVDRLADYNSSIATWKPSGQQVMQTFMRQAIPMTWDFPESNVLGLTAICWKNCVKYSSDNLSATAGVALKTEAGVANLGDASTQTISANKVISTDPPYYDNVPYADLSDYFYVWMRRSLKSVFPDMFTTIAVPKSDELVAFAYRHEDGKAGAEAFFLGGMTQAMRRIVELAHPSFPVSIYYAFKQAESDDAGGTKNTGWDTFLAAVIDAGFAISGTWPMRTELANRIRGSESNALASSIVLVCRKRAANAPSATRREFINALKAELPVAFAHLQRGNIAPVDLAQAVIGPGMAVYTRYGQVFEAGGEKLSVREALALINQTLDEILAEQEGDFDADTRWALTWFEQMGFSEGEYGLAEQLSKSKNTSVDGMVDAGILESKRGKVKLLRPDELQTDWDPATDKRLTTWEMVHHLIRALTNGGEDAAAALVAKLGAKAEVARELAYRLFAVSESKKRASEALAYNGLVQSWPEIDRLSREVKITETEQGDLFGAPEE